MPISWAQYILKIKEERGLSYGALARLTETSYSYWHNQIFQVKGPPTLEKARKIAEALEINADNFVNMVFRDRILYYLQRQKLPDPPTKSIATLLKSLRNWEPENGQELRRYIMLTLMESLGMDFAKDLNELKDEELLRHLNELVRELHPTEAETGQEDFSGALEGTSD